ncbi:MAG: hypothetical protein WC889_09150 [Myxococcota bacterium]|jgi:Flp pilus assembly pilin Flp
MNTKTQKLIKRKRAQGMTEYIIIVALIAVGTIFAVTLFGNNIRALFSASSQALGGNTTVNLMTDQTAAEHKKDLKTFGNNTK